jgi:hypothetical protein
MVYDQKFHSILTIIYELAAHYQMWSDISKPPSSFVP